MTEKTISGYVIYEGKQIGIVDGTYIDDSQNSTQEQIVSRTISITVKDEYGNQIGYGELEYTDYITYDSGGSRTINITGNITDDMNSIVGTVSGSIVDDYGYIQQYTVTSTSGFPWWIIILISGLVLLSRREKK